MEPKPTGRTISTESVERLKRFLPVFSNLSDREVNARVDSLLSSGGMTQADIEALYQQDLPMPSGEENN
jgi:hypothetical protein